MACLPVSQQTYLEKKKHHSHITLFVKSKFLRGVISLWCDGQQSLLVVVVLFCVRHFVFDGKCLQRSRKHKWCEQEAGARSSAGGEGGSLDASFEDCFTIRKDCHFTLGMETPFGYEQCFLSLNSNVCKNPTNNFRVKPLLNEVYVATWLKASYAVKLYRSLYKSINFFAVMKVCWESLTSLESVASAAYKYHRGNVCFLWHRVWHFKIKSKL